MLGKLTSWLRLGELVDLELIRGFVAFRTAELTQLVDDAGKSAVVFEALRLGLRGLVVVHLDIIVLRRVLRGRWRRVLGRVATRKLIAATF